MSSKGEGIKTPKQCVNANKERGKGKGRRREKVICSHGECVRTNDCVAAKVTCN